MSRVETSVLIKAPLETVFAFHDDPRNLLKVLPPYLRVEILEAPGRLREGASLKYVMYVGPLRFDWQAKITSYDPPRQFVDVQTAGPFHQFVHTHLLSPEGEGTRLTDIIEYELPLGPLGELADRIQIRARLTEVLEHGQQATRSFLEKTA